MAATKIAASRKGAKTKQDAFKVISTMHAVRHSIDKFKGSDTNSKYVFISTWKDKNALKIGIIFIDKAYTIYNLNQ